MKNLKDNVTTIVAFLLIIVGAVQTYLTVNAGNAINWGQLSLYVFSAISSYLIGKNPNGTTKVIDPVTGQQSKDPTITKAEQEVKTELLKK